MSTAAHIYSGMFIAPSGTALGIKNIKYQKIQVKNVHNLMLAAWLGSRDVYSLD